MQRTAWGGQGVYAPAHCRVLHQWWGMMRFPTSVDHHRTPTTPVLIDKKRFYPVYIRGRIAACKRYPEKILQAPRGKFPLIENHHQGKTVNGVMSRIMRTK